VTGQFLVGIVDGVDGDQEPDAVPASGTVTFTASVPYLPDPTGTPDPATILTTSVVAVLDSAGYLCTPQRGTLTPAYRGVRLIATDDPDLSVEGWTWNAVYNFAPVNGTAVAIPTHSLAVPAGTSIDLAVAVKVPSSNGIGIEQAEALAASAQAAAVAAAASAADASEVTDAGVSALLSDAGSDTRAVVNGVVTVATAGKLDTTVAAATYVKAANLDSAAAAKVLTSGTSLNNAVKVSVNAAAASKIAMTEKGAASGVAQLDSGSKVPVAQIPDLSASYAAKSVETSKLDASQKGAASGVASLDSGTKIPVAQIPDAVKPDNSGKPVGKGELMFNVKDYGAKGDGATDDATSVQNTITAAAGGGIVYFPPGTYNIGSPLSLTASNIQLRGAGQSSVLRVPPGNSTSNALIYRVTGAWVENVSVTDLRFEGRWEEFNSQIVGANGLITMKFVRGLRIERCYLKNSRAFSLNINNCDDVTVADSRFENGARDFIAVWGTPRISIINNKLNHNDDDGISVNIEATGLTAPSRAQVTITGNHLSDTGPIRTQAPKGVVITGNTLSRTRGMGIYLGVLNATATDLSTGHSNIIQGNVIRDVIDRQWNIDGAMGSVNLRTYILVESLVPQNGGLAAVPGQVSSGAAVAPYDYNYNLATVSGNAGPLRMPHGVLVTGNICKRTLPAVSAYSTWGHGAGYSMNGWKDYAVVDDHLRGCGVRLNLPLQNVVVESNILEAGRWGVYLTMQAGVTNADRLAQGIRIRNNEIRDFDSVGIGWGETVLTHQNITIEGNHLNGDPNFLSANRVAGGAWSAANVNPTAINVPYMGGVVVARNTVSNSGFAINQTGASAVQDIDSNLVIADAAAGGYNAANKGVGTLPGIGNGAQWWLLARDCDPTSATFGQSLGSTSRNASSQPTSGKWLAGMMVSARTSGVTGGKILLGWLRLTTGSAHVAGTDWSPMYATNV